MTTIALLPGGFADFDGRAAQYSASGGALAAAAAAQRAIDWMVMPFELTQERFDSVPRELRNALGSLVNVPAEDIVLDPRQQCIL